jgi:hypothetical protein
MCKTVPMRHRNWLPLMLGFVLASTGCAATHREWEVWRTHPTHFASDDHLGFSAARSVGAAPEVTPQLMDRAKAQGWWGRNAPRTVSQADVAGRWEGTWRGHGWSRTLRGGVAKAEFTVDGATGVGRLTLIDARTADGVPVAVRQASSFGAPVEISVSETGMWMNGTERDQPFAASFTVEGNRLVGEFLYTGSPVRIELTRLP